jgi:ABC-type phosphate/phosphonate transport system substrate-binding protein
MMDEHHNAFPTALRSTKSKRITRSVIPAEAIAMIDGYEARFCVAHELSKLFGRRVTLTIATDSQSLFNAMSRGSTT